jgi:hypothetical protein
MRRIACSWAAFQKTARGRARTPKACAKWNTALLPFRIRIAPRLYWVKSFRSMLSVVQKTEKKACQTFAHPIKPEGNHTKKLQKVLTR